MKNIKVFYGDDHELQHHGIKRLLTFYNEEHDDYNIDIEGTSTDKNGLISACAHQKADVYLVDLGFKDTIGDLGILHELKSVDPEAKIVVYSSREKLWTMLGAYKAGALGYVCKVDNLDYLTDAIVEVFEGHRYTMPSRLTEIRDLCLDDPLSALDNREREVFLSFAHGLTITQVAKSLELSRKTIESIVTNKIKPLFNMTSTQIRSGAIEMGIIDIQRG